MTRLLRRLRYLLQRDRHERELDDELRFHLEMKRQEMESRGLDRAEAAAAARRALGNLPLTRDHVRDVWIAPWLQSVAQDVRYGLRTLRRHSGFTAVAVATLALGIGANTAVFSVVNTVLLTPLPYRDSDRLVHIVQNAGAPMTSDGPAPRALAALDTVQLLSFRSQIRSLSHVAAFGITSATLTGQGDSVRLDGAEVSPDTFAMLGVRPVLGRPFDRRDELEGADPVVILGHGLWQRRFGADPEVIDRSVTIEGVDRSVLGVMPSRFAFPDAQTQFWVPFVLSAPESGRRRRVPVLARVQDGFTREAAAAEVNTLLAGMGAGGVPPPPPPPGAGAGPPVPRGAPPRAPAARSSGAAGTPPGFGLVGVQDRLTAPGPAGADRSHGGRRSGAAYRVRERREPAARAGRGAGARGRRAPGPRRQPGAPAPAVADREPVASPSSAAVWASPWPTRECACWRPSPRRSPGVTSNRRSSCRGSTRSPSTARCWCSPSSCPC